MGSAEGAGARAAPRLTASEAIALTAARAPRSGFFFDFDGTLAAIGDDPAEVRPVAGALAALDHLARHAVRLAIVSARPVGFLRSHFGQVPGITLHGLYGLETMRPGEGVTTDPVAARWVPVVRDLVRRASRELPAAFVEDKRLSVALHYRRAPEQRAAVESWADDAARRFGVRAQRGRMVVELRPPVERDKGTVVRAEIEDLACAWYFGDDVSDLRAFGAVTGRRSEGDGFVGVCVAVANPETGAELAQAADIVIESAEAVPAFLERVAAGLAPAPPAGGIGTGT